GRAREEGRKAAKRPMLFRRKEWGTIAEMISSRLFSKARPVRFASAWALAWIYDRFEPQISPVAAKRLVELALRDKSLQVVRQSSWALMNGRTGGLLPDSASWMLEPDDKL